ncbi:hypothetical protein MRX96_006140 [Rhipicephalus microplus]
MLLQSMLSSQETPQCRAAPRFTEDEKTVLVSPVREYIIKCKKNDAASTVKKKETWKEIAKCYNSNHEITRHDRLQLKKCWKNLKQKWKEETAREKESAIKLVS